MLAIASKLKASNALLGLLPNRFVISRARLTYSRSTWPDPITQPSLSQFLQEINYFDEPKKFVNIGLKLDRGDVKNLSSKKKTHPDSKSHALDHSQLHLDNLLEQLGKETELPPFSDDDALVSLEQAANLALSHGIYRDLFDHYIPNSDYIYFTPEQATRLDKIIPHYWITDLPHSRVKKNRAEPRPIHYFEPIINVHVNFISESHDGSQCSNVPRYGNIIPASKASTKPAVALDGRWLMADPFSSSLVQPSQIDNKISGVLSICNAEMLSKQSYYSIVMLNLDSVHPDMPNLHWFISNISTNNSPKDSELEYDEMCDFLPVHGIRGFGHSRYVFLVFQHDSKLDVTKTKIHGYSFNDRKFDTKFFIDQHKTINMTPVGLSWFQTAWDESSNKIFHDYLQMRAPVYEVVQPKYEQSDLHKKPYPGKIPFNVFLDHCRDIKDINQQVLLERLSTIDSLDYKDQFARPQVPPTVFDDEPGPSWMRSVSMKKKNKVGYWRGLRPASATIPLNNNADLDHPIRPLESSKKLPPGHPNQYEGRHKRKLLKDLPYSKPANEHRSVFIQEDHEIYLDQVHRIVKEFEAKEKNAMNEESK